MQYIWRYEQQEQVRQVVRYDDIQSCFHSTVYITECIVCKYDESDNNNDYDDDDDNNNNVI